MMVHPSIDRTLPARIDGYGAIRPYAGEEPAEAGPSSVVREIGRSKLLPSIDAAIEACGLKDGATISFHHHLRNGDRVLNAVLDRVARKGLKGISVAATSLFPIHAPLVAHMESGTVTGISSGFMAGPVAVAVSRGGLSMPAVLLTHGGRARAIAAGEIVIDVAFVAAPTADPRGNLNGVQGPSACGTLGYPMTDVAHARHVVVITDNLVSYPACPIEIAEDRVDFVVEVASIGDSSGIETRTTLPTTDPAGLLIADLAARVIEASGLLVEGFSFQTGAGGVSLAAAAAVQERMRKRNVVGSFASGGITGQHVAMLEAGLFRTLLDVQCFDRAAVASYARNAHHQGMSASMYANPHRRGAVVDRLDAVILGATEIDLRFDVNVTTTSEGLIIGGSGGHADTAAGATLAIVTSRILASGRPKIVDRVRTLTTPGGSIGVVITDAGIAVNPMREELRDRLVAAGLPLVSIEALRAKAVQAQTVPTPQALPGGRPVAVMQYRDGSVIDLIHQVEDS